MFLWLKRYLPQCKVQSKIVSEKYGINRGGGDYQYAMV